MSLSLDENKSTFQIRGFEPGRIQVNEQIFTHSLIVTPQKLITDWRPQFFSELKQEDFNEVIQLKPAVLLIGTGEKLFFPAVEIYGNVINAGIGVEIMDSRAACRTFNALTAEDRNVIAAILIK